MRARIGDEPDRGLFVFLKSIMAYPSTNHKAVTTRCSDKVTLVSPYVVLWVARVGNPSVGLLGPSVRITRLLRSLPCPQWLS